MVQHYTEYSPLSIVKLFRGSHLWPPLFFLSDTILGRVPDVCQKLAHRLLICRSCAVNQAASGTKIHISGHFTCQG